MTSKVEAIRVMSVILRDASRAPLARTTLRDRACPKGISYATFENVFDFLVSDGNIKKVNLKKRAPYGITEKGRKFLAWRELA